MTAIPSSINDVTAGWVAEATGLDVTDIDVELIGVGVGISSAAYRLTLTGNDVPHTLVMKLPALDGAALFTASMLGMYTREVRFFDELSSLSPIRVPQGYGGASTDDGSGYYLFMEDMGGHRVVDQIAGMAISDAEQAVEELAKWHATFWGKADRHVESGAAVSIADDMYRQVLPSVFGEGWKGIQADMEVHPTIADVAPRWASKLNEMLDVLSTPPTTLVHGDYRADNIFFAVDGSVVLLDFQLTGLGSGALDLAYFVTQSLLPDVAADNERGLFDRYVAGLIAGGVPKAETSHLWENYRVAALFCLVYPVAGGQYDSNDPRALALADTMLARCARAIDDLSLRELL